MRAAARAGRKLVLVPQANAAEAQAVGAEVGVEVRPVATIAEALQVCLVEPAQNP
jgi:predicted ATP-dependent protease